MEHHLLQHYGLKTTTLLKEISELEATGYSSVTATEFFYLTF